MLVARPRAAKPGIVGDIDEHPRLLECRQIQAAVGIFVADAQRQDGAAGGDRGLIGGPAVKSEYGRLMSRSQERTKAGTGKNSANGTRWCLS